MNRKPAKAAALFAVTSSMDHVALGKSSLAIGLACCLALTAAEARALTLGELVVHSRLGQPLRAQLAVAVGQGEAVEESCLSLAKPARGSENQVPILSSAKFSVEATDTGQLIRISTLAAISEPAVKLVLQLNCDGQTNVSREFTLLLDPPEYGTPEAPVVLQPTTEPEPSVGVLAAKAEAQSIASAKVPGSIRPSHSASRTVSQSKPKARKSPSVETARRSLRQAPNRPGEFRLKLSTGTIDLSASSQMTDAERLQLREKQLLLEADDQVASILALKNRVQQLEAQLAAMNLKLSAEIPQSQPVKRSNEKPPVVAAQPTGRAPGKLAFWLGMALLFPLLVLFIVVRNRKRLRESERQHEMESEYGLHAQIETLPASTAKPTGVTVARPVLTTMEGHQKPATEEAYYDPNSIFNPPDEKITLTEVDSVVEEADLYMIYGWTQKAVDLLLQHIEKSPAEVQPWMMLFDVYHSQELKDAFEKLATRFHSTFDNRELWEKVQALGRDLEPANEMYACSAANTLNSDPEADTLHTEEEPLDLSAHGDIAGAADVAPESEPESPPQQAPNKFQQGSRG
jgi:pilus assembly protein FimV